MTAYILDALVLVTTVSSLFLARWVPKINAAIKVQFGTGAALYVLGSQLTARALWVWLAFVTGYWQYAALTLVPMFIELAAKQGRKGA